MTPATPNLTSHRLTTGHGCPEQLAAAIAAGWPVLVQARVSNPAGTASLEAVVTNAFTTCAALARNDVFPDLPRLLPARNDLVQRMREESEVVFSVDEDGETFENRFLTLTVPGCEQVHLHLSCGSGRKLDDESQHQPVALHAARYIRRIRPTVVCAAEVARWSRDPWALQPWARAITSLEGPLGHLPYISYDGDRPKPFTAAVRIDLFSRATEAQAETLSMKARTTNAIRGREPVVATEGWCLYPFSTAPPPPLATVWIQTEGSGPRGEQAVIFDVPSVRQALEGRIVYGLPQIRLDDGTGVDQLQLVRDFFDRRGLPEWPVRRLIPDLVNRGLSTAGVRRQHKDVTRSWRGQALSKSRVWGIVDALEKHLEYYHQGHLVRRVGDKGEPMEFAILMPPDGKPFLTEESYQRIKRLRAEHLDADRRAQRFPFGHQPLTINGRPGRMVGAISDDGAVIYRTRPISVSAATAGGIEAGNLTVTRHREPGRWPAGRIPADAFARSLMEAMALHHASLTAFIPPSLPVQSRAAEQHAATQLLLDRKVKEKSRLYAKLFPSSDEPALSGQLQMDANDHYNRLCAQVTSLTAEREAILAALERDQQQADPQSIAVGELLAAVAALKDPLDVAFHDRWRRSIQDLTITTSCDRSGVEEKVVTEWSGQLLLHERNDQRVIPFSGSFDTASGRRNTNVESVIAELRSGNPRALRLSYWNHGQGHARLRRALGVDEGEPMPALTIKDPRLLRIAMELLYPPLDRCGKTSPLPPDAGTRSPVLVGPPLTDAQMPAAARRLREPVRLLRRVAAVTQAQGYVPGVPRKWRTAGDTAVAQVCAMACRRGGVLSKQDFDTPTWAILRHAAKRCDPRLFAFPRGLIVMQPCLCGSFRRGHLTIREATEPICWSCRKDITGIEWPAKPYDRYRCRVPSRDTSGASA